jgi:hypothetical protein
MRRSILPTLLAIAAMVLMAFAAGSASAQIEVSHEGGDHCSSISAETNHAFTGGCHLSVASVASAPIEWRALFGIMYLCDSAYETRLDENGEGFTYNQKLTVPGNPSNPCGIQPCKEANGAAEPWLFELVGEGDGTAADPGLMEVALCLTGAFGIVPDCHLDGLEVTYSHDTGEVSPPGVTHKFCENDTTHALLPHWLIAAEAPGIAVQ